MRTSQAHLGEGRKLSGIQTNSNLFLKFQSQTQVPKSGYKHNIIIHGDSNQVIHI